MKKANDEVIAGGVAYRAHERCWPAGVPTFDTDVVGAPLFIYQRPNEIVVVMESGPEVRHIYLNVPHSANPLNRPGTENWSAITKARDTLVIDTIGQTDRTFADNYRTPHTTQMHVIERWKLSADGKSGRCLGPLSTTREHSQRPMRARSAGGVCRFRSRKSSVQRTTPKISLVLKSPFHKRPSRISE